MNLGGHRSTPNADQSKPGNWSCGCHSQIFQGLQKLVGDLRIAVSLPSNPLLPTHFLPTSGYHVISQSRSLRPLMLSLGVTAGSLRHPSIHEGRGRALEGS